MNKIVDEMWELHNRLILNCLNKLDGKIWINITGGLDSRVLAGIVSKHQKIDMGIYFYFKETKDNVEYVSKIVNRLDYIDFLFIDMKSKDRNTWGDSPLEIASENYNLKEYNMIVSSYSDIPTGLSKSKARERQFYLQKNWFMEQSQEEVKMFKSVNNPLWNPQLIGYLQSVPRHRKLFQYSYIQMIKKYLPSVYNVPRCYEGTGNPTRLDLYPVRRLLDKLKGVKVEDI